MSRIFISYRHVKPDDELAAFLKAFFASRGFETFIDTGIGVGEDWATAIDQALRETDFFIVLLSEYSIVSDMVRKEVALAHELAKATARRPRTLPVRVNFEGKLPYDLGAYLDRLQSLLWKPDQPLNTMAEQLLEAMRTAAPAELRARAQEISYEGNEELDAVTEGKGAPLPAADPRLVAIPDPGTLRIDSPFYVRRDSDDAAEACLRQQTPTTFVNGPRQFGKSSLLARMHAQAQALNRKSWYLDFQLVDSEHMGSLDTLFRHLARQMRRAFGASLNPKEMWDDDEGPIGNLTVYLDEAVLTQTEPSIQIIFDGAERLFDRPYRNDFFATLRGWHNFRSTNPKYRKLMVVIGHLSTPHPLIRDPNQSPFNVGHAIVLAPFGRREIAELADKHGLNLTSDEISGLFDLLGGHPYLTRIGIYTLVTNKWKLDRLLSVAENESGPFGDHLRAVAWILSEAPELRASFREIIHGIDCRDGDIVHQLWAAGLIGGEKRAGVPGVCQLYERYFRHRL